MREFVRSWILPFAKKQGWKRFCEIGASNGVSTDEILHLSNVEHCIIDPCLDTDLVRKYSSDPRVTVLKALSLDALRSVVGTYDCILIDGDHNWYTVYNELQTIQQRGLLRRGGVIFLHDVVWPYGRRDMYYQPDTIPAEFRQPYAIKGMIRGQSKLCEDGGVNSQLCNAIYEGGPRNGVRAAVEDFIRQHVDDYKYCQLQNQFGMGLLQYRSNKASENASLLLLRLKVHIFNLVFRARSLLFRT
jgi:hypothetical protein